MNVDVKSSKSNTDSASARGGKWKGSKPARDVIICKTATIPLAEIRHSFEGLADKYPPVLDVHQAAELAKLAPGTLKRKVSEGCFKNCVSPGKPLRFWRDRFVQEIMK